MPRLATEDTDVGHGCFLRRYTSAVRDASGVVSLIEQPGCNETELEKIGERAERDKNYTNLFGVPTVAFSSPITNDQESLCLTVSVVSQETVKFCC